MIKCKEGHVEFIGFPWTIIADMSCVVEAFTKKFGNDAFEEALKLAMTSASELNDMANESKDRMDEESKKLFEIFGALERMAMEDD